MRLGGQGGCPSDRRTEHSGPRGWREAGRLGCEAGRPHVGSATSVPGGEACGVLGPGLLPGLETCLGAGGRKWGARCTRFAGWTENSVLSGRHAAPASGSDGLTLQAVRRTWAIRQRRASQSSPASATRPAGPRTRHRRRRLADAHRDQPRRACSSGQAGPKRGGQEAGHEACSTPRRPFSH